MGEMSTFSSDNLGSHVIEPSSIWSDDFRAFLLARREALLARIECATGKLIPRDQPSADSEEEQDNESEGDSDQ